MERYVRVEVEDVYALLAKVHFIPMETDERGETNEKKMWKV